MCAWVCMCVWCVCLCAHVSQKVPFRTCFSLSAMTIELWWAGWMSSLLHNLMVLYRDLDGFPVTSQRIAESPFFLPFGKWDCRVVPEAPWVGELSDEVMQWTTWVAEVGWGRTFTRSGVSGEILEGCRFTAGKRRKAILGHICWGPKNSPSLF